MLGMHASCKYSSNHSAALNVHSSKFVLSFTIVLTLIIFCTLFGARTVYSAGNESPAQAMNTISVLDFGAVGDGVHDDSRAFQRAIDTASSRNVALLIPPSDTPYFIGNTLIVRNNTHIIGYGATLFMPSSQTVRNLLRSSSRNFTSNVTIEGLTLMSANDRTGSNIRANSLTSNIQGIYFMGVANLRLKDTTIHNMSTGLKFNWGASRELNRNITIDNLRIFNAGTALLVHSTRDLVMTDSTLDARAGASRFLHSAYISGNTSNLLFDNVRFINSFGGGIHIYNGHQDKLPPQNITFTNCTVDNTRTGVYIFSGARDINITGMKISNYARAFKIWDASGINISDVSISRQLHTFDTNEFFAFKFFNMSDSEISDITIDGAGKTGQLFLIRSAANVRVSSVNAFNLNNNRFVFANVDSMVKNVVFENSRIQWNSTNWHRISIRSRGSDAIFRNNVFINSGTETVSLSFNSAGTDVLLENNSYMGFRSLTHSADHATAQNNIRLLSTN